MRRQEFFSIWSTLHLGAEIKGIVKGWLVISYGISRILVALRISPNALTIFGVAFACAGVFFPLSWVALLFLVLSLLCDGVDGSVAIISKSESEFGAVLDSVADRLSEAAWFYMLYQWGIDPGIALALFVIASTQEYARARMASLGFREIGVVTPAERPVRASAIAIFMVLVLLDFSFAPIVIYFFTAMALFSVYQVMMAAHRHLR